MEYKKLLTLHRVCAVLGFCLSAFGIIFLLLLIPSFIEHHVSRQIVLKDGWSMRNSWEGLSYSHELDCYLFNITNPDDILNGAQPIVKEVGPFVYDVRQEKMNVVDHDEDDTLSYTMKRTFIFNSVKSNSLSDEDELTLVHSLIFGTPNAVLRFQPAIMRLMSRSIDHLYNYPKSPFVKAKVKTFLFDGYELNCEGLEEFFAKVVCNDVKEFWFSYRMEIIRPDFYTSSAWGWLNDSLIWVGPTRINRGIKDISKIGTIVEYNNTKSFAMWDDEKCDTYRGTDGTMFRPFLKQTDNLHVVYPLMGRSLTYQYDSKVKHRGIKCFRYTATMSTELESNPSDKCYCLTSDNCPKNGVYEYWKVVKWSVLCSNPHFYLADPYYIDHVTGLNPEKEKHMSYIDVHPRTGTVVSARFRYQYSSQILQQPKYRLFKNVSEGIMPLAWYEERFDLPKFAVQQLEKLSFIIALEKFIAYFIIFIGFILQGVGAFHELTKLQESRKQSRN